MDNLIPECTGYDRFRHAEFCIDCGIRASIERENHQDPMQENGIPYNFIILHLLERIESLERRMKNVENS